MLNIIEVMRLPVGTKIKTDINKEITLIVVEWDDGRKYLTLEDDFRKVFLDSEITESKFCIKGKKLLN